jgi:hypothetical protein
MSPDDGGSRLSNRLVGFIMVFTATLSASFGYSSIDAFARHGDWNELLTGAILLALVPVAGLVAASLLRTPRQA